MVSSGGISPKTGQHTHRWFRCTLLALTVGTMVRSDTIFDSDLDFDKFPHPNQYIGSDMVVNAYSLTDLDPDAVCLDGSPNYYFWTPAVNESAKHTWIVHLRGGGADCVSARECSEHCRNSPHDCAVPQWMQSGFNYHMRGLFTSETPLLGGANYAWMINCVGDAYLGDTVYENLDPEHAGQALHLRGRAVLDTFLRALVDRHGLGLDPDHRDLLLFAGTSAGARGLLASLEYVPEVLGPAAAASVELVALLDSAAVLDAAPLNATPPWNDFAGFGRRSEALARFANVTRFGRQCSQDYLGEEWKCLVGQYRLPYARGVPYLLYASQYDDEQLSENLMGSVIEEGDHCPPDDEYEEAYVEAFANATRTLLRTLTQECAGGRCAVFSPACWTHALAWYYDESFRTKTVNGYTLEQTLWQLLVKLGYGPQLGRAIEVAMFNSAMEEMEWDGTMGGQDEAGLQYVELCSPGTAMVTQGCGDMCTLIGSKCGIRFREHPEPDDDACTLPSTQNLEYCVEKKAAEETEEETEAAEETVEEETTTYVSSAIHFLSMILVVTALAILYQIRQHYVLMKLAEHENNTLMPRVTIQNTGYGAIPTSQDEEEEESNSLLG